ncbi:MAG: HMA2 domain-containing protein [Aulosira sp. ZfuVER01]|nr:hypothetical protein [Aulosira sp. ZfuVER01]MDZ7996419.1 hypothetical protein [Aulosira sp. DedVER01a]MDZ8050373.1 hypothetical protein [Aulosira sp. ZfuCHP01]
MSTNNYGHLTQMPQIIEQTAISIPSKLIPTKIISDTPGRLRLRIAPRDRQAGKMQTIANVLEAKPNVSQVKTNIHGGSILIHHDRGDDSLANVLATLQDIGMIFVDIAEGNTEASVGVSNAVVDLNKRVQAATNSAVDLRFLFPLGLSILAVRQLLIKGLQFETIPWYVLAWYAFDSFLKLNQPRQLQPYREYTRSQPTNADI